VISVAAAPFQAAGGGSVSRQEAGIGYVAAVDGLRALAILSVLFYHLRPDLVPGGFGGVDLFFVISGFVVTSSLAHLRFDRLGRLLAYFYGRRIVRIVPALLAMLAAASLASVLLVPDSPPLHEAKATAAAASLGASNLLLALLGNDYFDPRQELNPFLHTWSLGVEEQFYLLFPFFFFFCQRVLSDPRQSLRAAAVIAALSLASLLLAWLMQSQPQLRFYLMPTRFWELGCGMILSLTFKLWQPTLARISDRAAAACGAGLLLAMGLAFFYPGGSLVPLRALLTVGAAGGLIALVCARPEAAPARALSRRAPVFIGKISYSLYLWHWPVFVLFRWTVGLEGSIEAVAAVALALALAVASYRLVEQPVRRWGKARARPGVAVLAGGGGALLAGAGAVWLLFGAAPNLTLSDFSRQAAAESAPEPGRCPVSESRRRFAGGFAYAWIPSCPGARAAPRLVAVGDSHALTYEASLRRYAGESGVPVYSYVKPACAFPPLSVPASSKLPCADFYRSVVAELSRSLSEGDTLFLASMHVPRIDEAGIRHADWEGGADGSRRGAAYVEARALLRRLAGTGASLVIQAPGPVFRSPAFRCSDWFNRRNPVCAGGIAVDREELTRLRRPALASMTALARAVPGLTIWDPFPILCPRDPCSAVVGGKALYLDTNHLAPFGQAFIYPGFRTAVATARRSR